MDIVRGGAGGRYSPLISAVLNYARSRITRAALVNLENNLYEAARHGVEYIREIVEEYIPSASALLPDQSEPDSTSDSYQVQSSETGSSNMETDEYRGIKRSREETQVESPDTESKAIATRSPVGGGAGGGAAPGHMSYMSSPTCMIRSGKIGSFMMRCLIVIRTFKEFMAPDGNLSSGNCIGYPCVYRFNKQPRMFLKTSDTAHLRSLDGGLFKTKFTNIHGSLKCINIGTTFIANDASSQTAVNNTVTALAGHCQGLEHKLGSLSSGIVAFDTTGAATSASAGTVNWETLQNPRVPDLSNGRYTPFTYGSGESAFQQYNGITTYRAKVSTAGVVDVRSIPDYGACFPHKSVVSAQGEIFKFHHKEADWSTQRWASADVGTSITDNVILPASAQAAQVFNAATQEGPSDAAGKDFGFGGDPFLSEGLAVDRFMVHGFHRRPGQEDLNFCHTLPAEHVMLVPATTKDPSSVQPITMYCVWESCADLEINYSAMNQSGYDIDRSHMQYAQALDLANSSAQWNGVTGFQARIVPTA